MTLFMSKNTRYNKKFTKITNINENCSEVSSEEDQYELGESDDYSEDSELTETAVMEGSSGGEEENFFNIRRNKKMARIISSSDTEDERTSIPSTTRDVMGIEIAVDGWVRLKAGKSMGRPSVHTIFKDIAGPTGYAKRNIMSGCVTSAFELIIDAHIMKHIKDCTETEARRVLKNDWKITVSELRSFLAILYARGAYEVRSLKVKAVVKKMGSFFFPRHNDQR